MKVIATTGTPLSGKGEFIRYASDKYSIPCYVMGEIAKDMARNAGKSVSEVGPFSARMREEYGEAIFAKKTVERIEKDSPTRCIIDGLRSLAELNYFKSELGDDFILVAIHAFYRVRLERHKSRGREDDSEPLRERDERELGWGLGDVIGEANYHINNNSNLENFKKKIDDLFSKLNMGP